MNLNNLQKLLLQNGFEIYGTEDNIVRLAERVRMHLMDSGVTIQLNSSLTINFTMRSESSQAPSRSEAEHFESVRVAAAATNTVQGYRESATTVRRIEHPSNPSDTLDTWYEISFGRELTSAAEGPILAALRQCLARPKTVHAPPGNA